jgi:type I restriction enzyme S subunit
LTELPSGWVASTLGDASAIVSGSTPRTTESSYWDGDIPWVTPDDLSRHGSKTISRGRRSISTAGLASCSARMLPTGTVLYTSRAPIGYVAIAAQPVCTNQGFKSLIPRPGINSDYLYWYMHYATPSIRNRASGTTFAEISAKGLAPVPLPIPPTAEQARIVAVLEEQFSRLGAGMEALQSARRKLTKMRIAVLQAAVTGRLVDQDESDGTADHLVGQAFTARDSTTESAGSGRTIPLDYLHDHLPVIPDSWRWVSLDAVADVVGGITKDAKKQTAPRLVEVPYLRVANVQRGYLDLRSVATIKATPEQVAALRLAAGDVLFNEGGDRDKLGRGWVWEGQIDPCIHQNHVFRARLFAPVLDPRLLSWHGNTFGQLWFDRGGRQTTNLASVSRTTLRSFPVPIPPLAEQRRIVAAAESYLSLIDAAEVMVQAAEPRASALGTSILASAFTGKLVSQDPDDEPASVLLDRIAADRVGSNGRMKVGARGQKITS